MILGSHNSWSYLKPSKWWMYLIRFTARCQDFDIYTQYNKYNVRCFDLRVRFDNGRLVISHGLIKYKINENELLDMLYWLDWHEDVCIRLVHEIRKNSDHTNDRIKKFKEFCYNLESRFTNIKFWGGMNLLPIQSIDYEFKYDPSCEEIYSSVCPPKVIDDWYPRLFALKNNAEIKEKGTDKDILLIDFVNIG